MANHRNQNLSDIEEKMIEEEKRRTTKKEMPVSGRSVFEIKKIKEKNLTNKEK